MASLLLWTGLTFILAVGEALAAFGIKASDVIKMLGALFMVAGLIVYYNEARTWNEPWRRP